MPCKIDDCAKPGGYVRGMCPMHYQRWRLRGDPLWEPSVLTVEERFWAKVAKSDGCWTWTGGSNQERGGYGVFKDELRMIGAHRYSWTLHFGAIPDGLFVLHRCDNPPCIRPDHLFLGTHEENMADMMKKGRNRAGEKASPAKLTEAQVLEIRSMAANGKRGCYGAISERFGISRSCVSIIVQGKTWRHLPVFRDAAGREPAERETA